MDEIEISTDGRTVWVNKAGCMIGRFSAKGIDIHHDGDCECKTTLMQRLGSNV